MVEDLSLPIQIFVGPTVREEDGLAKSSRNQYLSEGDRAVAPALFAAIAGTGDKLRNGSRDFAELEKQAINELAKSGFEPEYVSIRRAEDMGEPDQGSRELVILASAWLGEARLIDNLVIEL